MENTSNIKKNYYSVWNKNEDKILLGSLKHKANDVGWWDTPRKKYYDNNRIFWFFQ